MNLQRFIIILVVVVLMALTLTYQHACIIHAGYRMSSLSRQREELTERQRTLAAELVELKRAEVIAAKVRTFGLELVPAGKQDGVMISAGWKVGRRY